MECGMELDVRASGNAIVVGIFSIVVGDWE
jgi:hypothetical protein